MQAKQIYIAPYARPQLHTTGITCCLHRSSAGALHSQLAMQDRMTGKVEITPRDDNLMQQVYLEIQLHGRQTGCPPPLKELVSSSMDLCVSKAWLSKV